MSEKDLPRQWGAKLMNKDGDSISVRVYTPPNCQVAKWNLKLDAVLLNNNQAKPYRYSHPDHFYIIFNPWCTG
jgi:hypothetical protein